MSSSILRLRIKIKDLPDEKTIESFSRLGFLVLGIQKIDWYKKLKEWPEETTAPYEMECSISSGQNLNRESWSRLFGLLTLLSPISLSLSFSGLSDAEWISPVSSLGTLFLANTYLQEIDEELSTLILSRDAEILEAARKASLPASLAAESALAKSPNNGS